MDQTENIKVYELAVLREAFGKIYTGEPLLDDPSVTDDIKLVDAQGLHASCREVAFSIMRNMAFAIDHRDPSLLQVVPQFPRLTDVDRIITNGLVFMWLDQCYNAALENEESLGDAVENLIKEKGGVGQQAGFTRYQ